MYSQTELHEQRQAMLVKKIEYLREEKRFAEMSIHDIKMRSAVVSDIIFTIRRCGMELGGHTEEAARWERTSVRYDERSSEGSAVDTGNKGGC